MNIELLGLLATVFVLVSFLFKDLKTIRRINIAGCVLFVAYGIAIHSWSVWILNGALAIIHIVKLIIGNKEAE